MNKQEVISKLESAIPKNNIDDYQRGEAAGLNFALLLLAELDEPVRPPEPKLLEPEKPVVPQFVADWLEVCKDNLALSLANSMNNVVMRTNNQPDKTIHWIAKNSETFAKAWIYGYEVEKEKLYRAKNRHTGEYLCYCFNFYHDKNISSKNQRFTAEEKRWKELGYWGNDLYVFEEVEGEDE